MQFSDTSNLTGLYQDTQFLLGIDSNALAVKDFTRLANRWYYKAVIEAWKAASDWRFDDTNQTNFAIATTDMVNNQQDYSIPTNALKMRRIEVKDNGGNWRLLQAFDSRNLDIALDEFEKTAGLPMFYRLVKNSIFLYPKPATASVTLTAGLKIYFDREVDEFVSTDTTQEPGLVEPFHRILSMGAAYDFALAKGLPNVNLLRNETEVLLKDLRDFYSANHEDTKLKFRPLREAYN